MQAYSSWQAPAGTLGRIVAEARARAEALRAAAAGLEAGAAAAPPAPSLAESLRGGGCVAVLAEVKRASPSKGRINAALDAPAQARAYETGGARGVSVLTEPVHFGGTLEDLEQVRRAVRIPALRKDFHVDRLQLVEARGAGASAVLLIARALAPAALRDLAAEAHGLGLEVLVEIRDEEELDRALETDAALIGVNNRNLETLRIDLAVSERLVPRIPRDRVAIFESGVVSAAEVERAAAAGADAVLVGSSVSASPDPAAAVRALAGVARGAR